MLHRITFVLIIVAVLAIGLTACGAEEAEPTAAPAPTNTPLPPTATALPPTDTPIPPTHTRVVPPTDTPAPAAPTATVSTDKDKDEGPLASLVPKWTSKQLFAQSEITSYRSRMDVTASGPAFEDETDLAFKILGEYVKDPHAEHLSITIGDEVFMEMVQIGDQSWVNFAGMWIESSDEDAGNITEDFMIFDVEDIGDLSEFEKVGTETINGLETTHYHFDENVLWKVLKDEEDVEGLEGLESFSGDLYTTKDGIVVKWVMHFEGTGFNDENAETKGSMDMTYELYDINAKIDIQPPEVPSSEESLGFEIPVPEGATQTLSMAGMTTYDVVDQTIEDLADFYKTELANLGFSHDSEAALVSADFAMLTFSDGSTEISITIMPGEDDGTVQVLIMTEAGG